VTQKPEIFILFDLQILLYKETRKTHSVQRNIGTVNVLWAPFLSTVPFYILNFLLAFVVAGDEILETKHSYGLALLLSID